MSVFLRSINKICNLTNDNSPSFNSKMNVPASVNENRSNTTVNVSKDLVAAAGFNVETPIVNALIGNITGALPTKRNGLLEPIKCDICDCEITSDITLNHHLNGSRHRKKLKALGILAQLEEEKGVKLQSSQNSNVFKCDICSLPLNSAQQLEFHLSGAKHKKKLAKVNMTEPDAIINSENFNKYSDHSKPSPAKKKKKQEHQYYNCGICNITMNSQTQFDQHLSAKKHKLKCIQVNVPNRCRSYSVGEFPRNYVHNAYMGPNYYNN